MDSIINHLETLDSKSLRKYVKEMPIKQLRSVKLELDKRYETVGDTGLSDFRYDELEHYLNKRDKVDVDKEYQGADGETGVFGVDDEDKVKLPYFMGSAMKIKPTDGKKLVTWLKNNKADEYLISAKLDGISCLAVYEDGQPVKLYTRGRKGTYGKNISYLNNLLSTIPKTLNENIAVRGELVMPLKTFEKKYSKDYENPRSIVQGLVSSKNKSVADLHFVVYEILNDKVVPPPSVQFDHLDELGFEVAKHHLIDNISIENLTTIIIDYKATSDYQLDGIIVQSNVPVKRTNKKYPTYLFSYKIDGSGVEVKVTDIEWNIGKWKTITPILIFEPVVIDGSTIRRATAHTASHVVKDGLGIGAIIRILKSGDIIPQYVEVIKRAKNVKLPTEYEWEWDKNKVNIIATSNEEIDKLSCIKRLASFFKKTETHEFGIAKVTKMFDNGMDSLVKIFEASEQQIIDAVESKAIGTKMYKNVRKLLTNPNMADIIGSSGAAGKGISSERVEQLLAHIPDIFDRGINITKDNMNEFKNEILAIPGFADITASIVVENLYWSSAFYNVIKMLSVVDEKLSEKPPKVLSSRLNGQLFTVTGFTDKTSDYTKKMLDTIVAEGGTWSVKFSSKTTSVIASSKSLENRSSKLKKAEDSGLRIYDMNTFLDEVFR